MENRLGRISLGVLISFGYRSRILSTVWLINNTHLILIVLDTGKFKIKTPVDSRSGEGPTTSYGRTGKGAL